MIAALARFAVSLGVPQSLARIAAILTVILVVVAALLLAKAAYDSRLIAGHDTAVAAQDATDARIADGNAATRRRSDDARLDAEADALQKVTDNAPAADPLAARRAYYDCIRVQQDARAAGKLTPAC
jgi:hypothetical protein